MTYGDIGIGIIGGSGLYEMAELTDREERTVATPFGEPSGRYVRLPVLYHIVEKRWVHTNGAFLAPDTPDFWEKSRGATWNDTCVPASPASVIQNPRPMR